MRRHPLIAKVSVQLVALIPSEVAGRRKHLRAGGRRAPGMHGPARLMPRVGCDSQPTLKALLPNRRTANRDRAEPHSGVVLSARQIEKG